MKTLFVKALMIAAAFLVLTAGAGMAQKPSKTEEIRIQTDLDCASCKKKIEDYMTFERGVTAVLADVPTKVVTITYRPSRTDEEKLVAAIKKLGFKAEVLQEKGQAE